MTVVIILIVLGILLFVIEFLLVPGSTLVGIGIRGNRGHMGADRNPFVKRFCNSHVPQGQNLEEADA